MAGNMIINLFTKLNFEFMIRFINLYNNITLIKFHVIQCYSNGGHDENLKV